MSETGILQSEKLGKALASVPLTAIYSSPLKRAMDTALAVARHHGLEIKQEPGLREIHAGQFEGVAVEQFVNGFSQFLVDWEIKGGSVNFEGGGENLGQFSDRVWRAATKIISANKDGIVALVSHYFVTSAIVCSALELPISHMVRIRIQPSSQTILEFKDGYAPRLLLLSDVCHLRDK